MDFHSFLHDLFNHYGNGTNFMTDAEWTLFLREAWLAPDLLDKSGDFRNFVISLPEFIDR